MGEVAIGTLLEVAWEERSRSRAPRFQSGERVLVVLEPPSGASIWLSRLPDPEQRSKTLGVAMRGDTFLRNPSLGTVNLLEHYLALSAADRAGVLGVGHLARLAATGEIPLAGLDSKLGQTGALQLTSALVRDDATEALQDALMALIVRHHLISMQAPLEAWAAIAALVLTDCAEGVAALGEIAEGHPDQSIRALAKIALGKEVGHTRD